MQTEHHVKNATVSFGLVPTVLKLVLHRETKTPAILVMRCQSSPCRLACQPPRLVLLDVGHVGLHEIAGRFDS